MKGWIGVDLDGTLARYDEWQGEDHIGEPLQPMVERVKVWLAQGKEVRIFTARASAWGRPTERLQKNIALIEEWCERHIGKKLPVTSDKDYECVAIWDDRAIQVEFNTGADLLEMLRIDWEYVAKTQTLVFSLEKQNRELRQRITDTKERA